ncbi:hypothetical protein JQ615_09640 [Bradyrhizobium jicamae]|uniref:Uncharacterized protein n=1 Tax=Bradyrhizobium jicamae TaxID=280332 RepID=A0ABS5FFT0_9BRAD|nr:hypothetical protein [Bradyrhizobium jicamae]MBR0795649.1 hypothetical protein [Bradyrhizobium jicamae]
MSTTPTKLKAKTPAGKTVIMFGLDKDRKPLAARFTAENEALLARAALTKGLRLAVPATKKHFEVVNKLPAGRLHASGNSHVPSVDQHLYDQINSLVGGDPGTISAPPSKSWAQLAPGHLVIAQATADDGWWPAIITKRSNDTLTLKWRDYPSESEIARPVSSVALLNND